MRLLATALKAVEKLERFAANSQNFIPAAEEAPADDLEADDLETDDLEADDQDTDDIETDEQDTGEQDTGEQDGDTATFQTLRAAGVNVEVVRRGKEGWIRRHWLPAIARLVA